MTNMEMNEQSRLQRGLLANILARLLWGGAAYYFALSEQTDSVSLFFQRVLWAFVFCCVLLGLVGGYSSLRACLAGRRQVLVTITAAILIGSNWLDVIWCINHGEVISASLGFFLAPIMAVVIGLIVFGEVLNGWTLAALTVCLAGVVTIFLPTGSGTVWPVLHIALSSSLYAMFRKAYPVPPLAGNLVETGIVLILLLACSLFFGVQLQPFGGGVDGLAYVIGIGVVTTLPMFLYVYSLGRIPLSAAGYLQYLTPSVMFLIGLLILKEAMEMHKVLGFSLIWLSIALQTIGRRAAAVPSQVRN